MLNSKPQVHMYTVVVAPVSWDGKGGAIHRGYILVLEGEGYTTSYKPIPGSGIANEPLGYIFKYSWSDQLHRERDKKKASSEWE